MRSIGNYQYPNRGSFKEALDIAQEAIDKYGGIIPTEKAAEKIGYKIKDRTKISGPVYTRLGDLASFGLFEKIRGAYKTTDLAEKALDPYDSANSMKGMAEAIRNIPIIERAFTEWEGKIPSETAFPAKIKRLIEGISWKDAQNHTESLRKLFIEGFSYLKPATEFTEGSPTGSEVGGDIMSTKNETGTMTITAKGIGFGVTKTLPFSAEGIESLKKLIEFLETQVRKEEVQDEPQTD